MIKTTFRRTRIYLLALVLIGSAASVGYQLLNNKDVAHAATASSATPCVGAPAPAQWKHVVVLMFENKSYGDVIGNSGAPYISSLAKQCTTNKNWHDADFKVDGSRDISGDYNSKPNYATLTSGVPPSVNGLKTDSYSTRTGVDNIYNHLISQGLSFKDYYGATSTTGCASSNFDGAYHDAIRYYTSIPAATCNAHDVPFNTFMNDVNSGNLPAFSFIVPTNDQNMHNCGDGCGESWAKANLPAFFDSAQYKSGDTAFFFLWDEDTPIPNVLIAPSITPGSTVPSPAGAPISHFSALRTWEEMLHLPLIGNTAQAPSLLSVFNGGGSPPPPPPPVDNPPAVNITAPANGATVGPPPVTVSANATDDKGVTKVEFYDGNGLIGTDTAAPYSLSWTPTQATGSHTLTAKAYDTGGHITTSSPVTVGFGNSTTPPPCENNPTNTLGTATMVVNTPAQGTYHIWSRLMAPDTTSNSYFLKIDSDCPSIVGDAASQTPNTWTWVDYQTGNIASHLTATLSAGNHTITMIGREANVKLDRVLLLSGSCTPTGTGENCVDTTNPTVSLTSPTNGQTVSGTVALTATATDNPGGCGVTKVDFLIDNSVVGTSSSSPYTFNWNSSAVSSASHTIAARATDCAGNVAISAATTVTVNNNVSDKTPPSAPASLQATSTSSNEIDLSWTASTDNVGVDHYVVNRNGNALASVKTTSYKDTSVSPNTRYSYTVVAVDAAGNQSQPSGTVTVATSGSTPDTQKPTAPTNLQVSVKSNTDVSLGWTASTDNVAVAKYVIVRNNTPLAETTSSVTSYEDTTVQPGVRYTYYIVAVDTSNNPSDPSGSQTVTMPTPPPATDTVPPTAPQGLSDSVASGQVNLSWAASTDNVGVVRYDIYRNNTRIGSTAATTFGDGTVNNGSTYSYYVVAFDAAGNQSPRSNQIQVTVSVPPSNNPQILTFQASDDAGLHENRPSTKYGRGVTMSVDASPTENFIIKFRVSGVNGRVITSAKLRLFNIDASKGSGGNFFATSSSWSEANVTWNNAPPIGARLASLGSVRKYHYYDVDLRNYIKGDGTYSLRATSSSKDGADYATRNAPTAKHRPQLIITVQ